MLKNLQLLVQACEQLAIPHRSIALAENIVQIQGKQGYIYFVNNQLPLNDISVGKIVVDKYYTYALLHGHIAMARTTAFLSPFEAKYQSYGVLPSISAIADGMMAAYSFPFIVKQNQGCGGTNVFCCRDRAMVMDSLEHIFNIKDKNYDFVALAQELIPIQKEYRAIFFDQKLQLLYYKNREQAKFDGNLSPLHWEGATAEMIMDPALHHQVEEFVGPIFEVLPLAYGGLDLVLDHHNRWWLVEINSSPNYGIFVRDNGPQPAIDVFKTILQTLI